MSEVEHNNQGCCTEVFTGCPSGCRAPWVLQRSVQLPIAPCLCGCEDDDNVVVRMMRISMAAAARGHCFNMEHGIHDINMLVQHMVVQHRVVLHATPHTLSQAGSHVECNFQSLLSIEARVTVAEVAAAQILRINAGTTTQAFCHILTCCNDDGGDVFNVM